MLHIGKPEFQPPLIGLSGIISCPEANPIDSVGIAIVRRRLVIGNKAGSVCRRGNLLNGQLAVRVLQDFQVQAEGVPALVAGQYYWATGCHLAAVLGCGDQREDGTGKDKGHEEQGGDQFSHHAPSSGAQ